MFAIANPFGRPITRESFRRLDLLIALWLVLLFVLLCLLTAPANAAQCNTIFLTEKNAGISFPLCPPNRATSAPGLLDNMTIGQSVPAPGNFSAVTQVQATPATLNATGALTGAQLINGIITSTSAAAVVATLPLGTAMDTANPSFGINTSFNFSVINTGGTNTVTMTAATGFTIVGNAVVAASSSGRFRAVRTATGTWVLYRLS